VLVLRLTKTLFPGTSVPITFTFAKAGSVTLTAAHPDLERRLAARRQHHRAGVGRLELSGAVGCGR